MSGWFPQWSPTGADVASGHQAIWVNGQAVLVNGYLVPGTSPVWLTPFEILYTSQIDGSLRMLEGFGGEWTDSLVRQQGGNSIAANGDDLWVIYRTDPVRLIWKDGAELVGYREPALSEDGHAAMLAQANGALFVGGAGSPIFPSAAQHPCWGHHGTTLMWESNQRIYGRVTPGQPTIDLTIPRLRCYKPVPIWTGSQLWYLFHDDGRVCVAPWGSTQGYVVYDGETDGPHDACAVSANEAVVAWSIRGVLRTGRLLLDPSRARTVELSPPVQVPVPPPPEPPPVHEEPPPMTNQDRDALIATCAAAVPQDVMLRALDRYLEHVLERDRCGDSMSRGALMFFIPQFQAGVVKQLGVHGLPHGAPEQVAGDWNAYADAGVALAVAAYEDAVNPL